MSIDTKLKESEIVARLGKADLHIHSNISDAKPSIEQILEYVENKTDLNVIAITDHDTIRGALKAKRIARKKGYRFEVIIGEEVSTKEGHILALFINEDIPPKLSAHASLERIKALGGIAIAPHPLFHKKNRRKLAIISGGIGFALLFRERYLFDGIEVINSTLTSQSENIAAALINDTLMIRAETGSSDAHILEAIGKSYTLFEGKTAAELRTAILTGQTRAVSEKWNFTAIMKFLYFFIPKGFRVTIYNFIHKIIDRKK